MFDITSKERLRDAYDFLSLLQNNPAPDSTTPEQKAYRAMTIANTKREIRAYVNRPASNVRIICGDYDGHMELVRLPDELDRVHKSEAAEWFDDNCYLEAYNSQYDCTGQEFTSWYHLFRRWGHWFAYHKVCRDV